jgi:hypothetical protein
MRVCIKVLLSSYLFFLVAFSGLANAHEATLTVNNLKTGETVSFTDSEISALPQHGFKSSTIWTEGVLYFSGPSLKTVLEAAGAAPARLRIFALNDYNIEFPVSHIGQDSPVLANRIDGKPFSVREKGPFWIVFPFDRDPAFRSEDIFSLSVWQVERIDILAD